MGLHTRIVLAAIALELVWLPLWEELRERSPALLAIVLAGPWLLACGGVLAGTRGRGAVLLGVLLFALDLAFELWVPMRFRVATTPWQIVRLGALVPAAALAPWLAGRGRGLASAGRGILGAALLIVFAGLAICLRGAATGGTTRGADAAIVLGTALDASGRATPSLVARVHHAARLWRQGRVRAIVLTGGPGPNGTPESVVADGIARRAGVPPEALIREERSRSTWQNVLEAARIARRMHFRSVLVVTEPFHVGRAVWLARAAGLPSPRPAPAPSPLWTARAAPYWIVREVANVPSALVHAHRGPTTPSPPRDPEIELLETTPVETSLGHADLRDAADVWPERIARARRTIEIAQFYASNAPEAGRLEPVVRALEAAGDRGVRVRFLAEASFDRVYPETLARLDAHPGIEVRRLDFSKLAGGIVHAKYFVIDREEVLLGSQNFDWRALAHIQELGVRVRDPAIARALGDVFETDWAIAGGGPVTSRAPTPARGYPFPAGFTLVASPRGWLPDESLWDLPHLLAWIDSAQSTVRLQLLMAGDEEHGRRWPVLTDALGRAARRGVQVEVLLADWALLPRTRPALVRLSAVPGIALRIVSIPQAQSGFIPFARVVHAKYMVVDGARAWIGTSNAEREYFLESRNVGLLAERVSVARRLDAFFAGTWASPYARDFDAAHPSAPPRIAE